MGIAWLGNNRRDVLSGWDNLLYLHIFTPGWLVDVKKNPKAPPSPCSRRSGRGRSEGKYPGCPVSRYTGSGAEHGRDIVYPLSDCRPKRLNITMRHLGCLEADATRGSEGVLRGRQAEVLYLIWQHESSRLGRHMFGRFLLAFLQCITIPCEGR